MSLNLISSENMFSNFINNNDIILDKHYDNLKNYYSYKFLDINTNDIYYSYFNLFKNYYYLKKDINLIYYIIILYYLDRNNLLGFIRFFIVNINKSNLDCSQLLNYNEIQYLSKIELIDYLKKIIELDYKNFILFIYCMQHYN
jgi:hypothetical protein|tara:strand:+ start:1855 stop:2283 length:429 start_codon:yes stop_codon:yes gene_type:complete